MDIAENVSLKDMNTFGIESTARYLVRISDVDQLIELTKSDIFRNHKHLVLGGGSNVLFTKDYSGLVIKNQIKGIEIVSEDEHEVVIKVGAGENWHQFVLYAVEKGWGGIENMSLIPGTVGAAPMQNIGAYGVEIKDVFVQLEAVAYENGELVTFNQKECDFGYRHSIFKSSHKNQYFITSVTLQLSKEPVVNTSYGVIRQTLEEKGIVEPTIKDVSDAVIAIRQGKLPDPAQIGNAGSFFKNPTISTAQFELLKSNHPKIVGYPNEQGVKVPAGWLIEHAGWKGKTFGDIGVHRNQALVLVNYGNGVGADLWQLSEDIKQSISEKYGIDLEREVNIV
ncbi:MAG: UDP-N-acetylmuramate dehydrogenase [Bacteroidota bacterium]